MVGLSCDKTAYSCSTSGDLETKGRAWHFESGQCVGGHCFPRSVGAFVCLLMGGGSTSRSTDPHLAAKTNSYWAFAMCQALFQVLYVQ